MRLPFKVPKREALLKWVLGKLIIKFGPLFPEYKRLEEEVSQLRALVLKGASNNTEWMETTEKAILVLSQRMDLLLEGMKNHQKMFEELKKAEDTWRGGKALSRLH